MELIALLTLTPAEGKRLIGKAISSMDKVQQAFQEGTTIIATSTTSAYVAEELLGKEIVNKGRFTIGVIGAEGCGITVPQGRYNHHVIIDGELSFMNTRELIPVLAKMGPSDIFIKGANAIDPYGNAGLLLHGVGGGAIRTAWGYITSNGITTIIAAGLEKYLPTSLSEVVPKYDKKRLALAMGWPCGMMVIQGIIITELEAFETLFSVKAIPIASGGINGGEGCKVRGM